MRGKVAVSIPNTGTCTSLVVFTAVSKRYRDVDVNIDYEAAARLNTFMPISMCERSANGTSLVTSSHSNTAKLHMSADLLLISSGFFCKAGNKKKKKYKHSEITHRFV